MLINEKDKLNDFLEKVSLELDIPDYVYEDATLKYEDVGSWLMMDDSELKNHAPEVYPQGSFRLGTVVRPLSNKDGCDIDLVCHLSLEKESTTQNNLKQIVGFRLKKRTDIAQILKSDRRCWTLDYPTENQMPHFHMDVLPAIPNSEHPPTGILITDTELIRWQKSNPKAFAEWFYNRMSVIFQERRAALAKLIEANLEDVPEWQIKTPLQRVVQILKRHRDTYFQQNKDSKPTSIIITTLAAYAYKNQANIYDALIDIVRDMPKYIENRNGQWWVPNPVDSEENFADMWNEAPDRQKNFVYWLNQVQEDFKKIGQKQTLNEAGDFLLSSLGENSVAKAATALGLTLSTRLPVVALSPLQVPALGGTSHCQSPLWPIKEYYRAKVTCSVYGKRGGRKLWELSDRPVPKKIWLRFSVVTNVPSPYDVHWQVVNTGKEAAEVGQLRGDFYDSDDPGTNVRWEATAYKGTHWVEAFIVRNGICVAKSGRKMVRIR